TRLLPEWAPNRSRPQRNAYHRFTVDRHLLEAAAEAARLADRVERPDLLVLGALFHDIGKGYPGDHRIVGVELVHRLAVRMGYDHADVETLEAMVRHHLLLPDVASRRDLEDEGTIRFVADEIGSVGTLELLAALTEADSIATSPSAWSPWKAELVRELAERTTRYLTGGWPGDVAPAFPQPEHLALLEAAEELVRLVDHRLLVITPDRPGTFSCISGALALHGVEILGANLHTEGSWALQELRLGGGIGLEEHPDRVTDDVRLALRRRLAITARLLRRASTYRYQRITTAQPAEPQVTVDNETSSTATVLEVRGPDSIGFLFRITRAFIELDLNIVRAKVQTLGDDVIDSFYVRGPDGKKVLDAEYLAEIEMAVLAAIGSDA
ncbi:MAG: HD domain-containing protein, partial [Actinobacteria bacterium]|nr:HD domain-containing protein [Actinomycetota bacterium]